MQLNQDLYMLKILLTKLKYVMKLPFLVIEPFEEINWLLLKVEHMHCYYLIVSF